MDHQTTELLVSITVDVAIAPLIHECWRVGAYTRWCCEGDMDATGLDPEKVEEGDPRCGYICFVGLPTAEVVSTLILCFIPEWEHRLEHSQRYNNSVVRFHRRDLDAMTAALREIPTAEGRRHTALCF